MKLKHIINTLKFIFILFYDTMHLRRVFCFCLKIKLSTVVLLQKMFLIYSNLIFKKTLFDIFTLFKEPLLFYLFFVF